MSELKPFTALELLNEMATIKEPYGLFEPYVWKDKIGDGWWHCEVKACCGKVIWSGKGETFDSAVKNCDKCIVKDFFNPSV